MDMDLARTALANGDLLAFAREACDEMVLLTCPHGDVKALAGRIGRTIILGSPTNDSISVAVAPTEEQAREFYLASVDRLSEGFARIAAMEEMFMAMGQGMTPTPDYVPGDWTTP